MLLRLADLFLNLSMIAEIMAKPLFEEASLASFKILGNMGKAAFQLKPIFQYT